MRLIHAVREYNRENNLDLKTLAIYTEPERTAMFVREADEAFLLGPASFLDPKDGQRKNAYLDYDGLERVLLEAEADAVWVGWGFVSEHPPFADLCAKLGINFIGPSGDTMRLLGDKITSKQIAEKAGVPVAPWSDGPVNSVAEAREHAKRIGLPLMVKATAGGGGRGIRAIRSMDELEVNYKESAQEALKGFGNDTMFMEYLVEGARHIEVQVIADKHGTVWPVGIRDCSIQRRNQKLIEESSSPVLTDQQEEDIKQAAARLCKEAGYHNAGTVEFLYDMKDQSFAFMEVNARLQVEHPVTEVSTDTDLVKLQIHVARGGKLEGDAPKKRGVAIEIRLNAEDPDKDFAPAPGLIELMRLPTGAGIRIDTGVELGDRIPSEFDSMIAKIIAHGKDRNEAIARLRRALSELAVVIRGGTTNRAFLFDLLGMPEVLSGSADVGWLDRSPPSSWDQTREHGELAVCLAAIQVYEEEFEGQRKLFFATAARGRPKVSPELGVKTELRHGGTVYKLKVFRFGDGRYAVDVDGRKLRILTESLSRFERRLSIGDETHRALSVIDGFDFLIEINGMPHRVSRDDSGMVRAPSPAVVVSINTEPGQTVAKGDTLLVLEAMKMEMRVTAPVAGAVAAIEVSRNEQVDAGSALVRLKPAAEDQDSQAASKLDFASLPASQADQDVPRARCLRALQELRYQVLGYDVDAETAGRRMKEYQESRPSVPFGETEVMEAENELLSAFADMLVMSETRPLVEPGQAGSTGRSPQESLYTYLRAMDGRGEGLPPSFVENLRDALSHYGVMSLDPSRELDEALLWMHKSHSRTRQQLGAVMAVLEHLHAAVGKTDMDLEGPSHEALDRLILVSQGRHMALEDMAREVHYEYVDKPIFEKARAEAYAQAEADIDALCEADDDATRAACIDKVVQNTQPLMTLISRRIVEAEPTQRGPLLECLTRRYYRIRDLENVQVHNGGERPVASAEYDHDNTRIHLITAHGNYEDIAAVGEAISPLLSAVPEEHDVVLDLYLHRTEPEAGEEDTQRQVLNAVESMHFPRKIRRLVAAVRVPGAGLGTTGQRFFTLRHGDDGYFEDTVYRGLHPMMAKRLHLWRLGNFELERLPSGEDIYLFRGVARDNPRDERLFAIAEVRDITQVRDEDGNLRGVPHFERMYSEAAAGIRLFQSHRPVRGRLHWNRMLLYVWPEMDLSMDDLDFLMHKMSPSSAGLGLEKLVVPVRIADPESGKLLNRVVEVSGGAAGQAPALDIKEVSDAPLVSLDPYRQTVVKMRARKLHYPYELVDMLTPSGDRRSAFPPGHFVEHDFDENGHLVAVYREVGENKANVVVGVITNNTEKFPEGMSRVIILGDPSGGMGSLAEPECSRICAALDLAETMKVPVEWFAVSAGAKIAMDSGTENMDWTAKVLRRIIEFTQDGGECNIVVHGINVGAQSYWNAEATMLMHTKGILIMTADGSMVLTGKQALDYAGSVSAEDNFGIGGYDRIMGPNGQAQYWAANIEQAAQILFRHYDHTYNHGSRFPRSFSSTDPVDRSINDYPYGSGHGGAEFRTVGEVFSDETNPGRKKPFAVRPIMHAAVDQDRPPLERWSAWRDGEVGVIWDAHLGGQPVCMIGMESHTRLRAGMVPADGPDRWTAGTLFPQSSRKIARAINAASGNRPLVVLANLSGFDGSPESLRNWQLEYGAEIGRAVVNFEGPVVFCVIGRYHGGAFVVFSKALNENMEVAALDGAFASVIGGAPAAGVVFVREVRKQTDTDPRVSKLAEALKTAEGADRARVRAEYEEVRKAVLMEKRGELAAEFDRIHSVQRAMDVGSVDRIIKPAELRPYLIDAVQRRMELELAELQAPVPAAAANE